MALALALLAAIAAATLLFFGFGVAATTTPANASGLGQTLSTCFLAVASNVSSIDPPLSGQMPSKTQNNFRALSLTPAFGSPSPFFKHFSRISAPPVASTTCLERVQCTSK